MIITPKIKMIYFKNILNNCLIYFFNEYNDLFIKQENKYIFASNFDKKKLEKIFIKYIQNEIKKLTKPYDVLNINYYFIIGGCLPINNILLKYKDSHYFPNKLETIINSDFKIRYYISEKDIKLDLIKFNDVFSNIFNLFFINNSAKNKILSPAYKNVFFIQHTNLDCYLMFKTIKNIYGASNCVNILKEEIKDYRNILLSINDKIDEYIHNKNKIKKTIEYQYIRDEIKIYCNNCIESISCKR